MKKNEFDFIEIYDQAFSISTKYYTHEKVKLSVLIKELLELEQNILDKRGKNKSRTEGHILTSLEMFFNDFLNSTNFKKVSLNEMLISETKTTKLKVIHSLSFEMFELAKDILNLKILHDNFSATRKGFAINIICQLLYKYTIENHDDYFRPIINEKSDKLKIIAFQSLEMLLTDTQMKLPDDIVKKLYSLTVKSKDRSVVVGALNVLIAIKQESEGGALNIIDDWKEKNYYNY